MAGQIVIFSDANFEGEGRLISDQQARLGDVDMNDKL